MWWPISPSLHLLIYLFSACRGQVFREVTASPVLRKSRSLAVGGSWRTQRESVQIRGGQTPRKAAPRAPRVPPCCQAPVLTTARLPLIVCSKKTPKLQKFFSEMIFERAERPDMGSNFVHGQQASTCMTNPIVWLLLPGMYCCEKNANFEMSRHWRSHPLLHLSRFKESTTENILWMVKGVKGARAPASPIRKSEISHGHHGGNLSQ